MCLSGKGDTPLLDQFMSDNLSLRNRNQMTIRPSRADLRSPGCALILEDVRYCAGLPASAETWRQPGTPARPGRRFRLQGLASVNPKVPSVREVLSVRPVLVGQAWRTHNRVRRKKRHALFILRKEF